MATLYEVWRLALPPQTTLSAGQPGGQAVRAVATLRSTQPALPALHGAELVLLTQSLLESLDPGLSLARLISRLQGAAVAALAISGTIDSAALEAASTTQTVLFRLPAECDLPLIRREIERLLADPEAQYERRAAQLYTALTRDALIEGSRSALLTVLEQWIGQPVTFPASPTARTTVPVIVDGRRIALLGSDGAQQWDQVALEQGALAFGLLVDKERAIRATEDRLRGDSIDLLLSGLPLDSNGLRRAAEQGLQVELGYVLLALQPVEPGRTEWLQSTIRRTFDRLQLQGAVRERNDVLLVALPIPANASTPATGEHEVRGLHQALLELGLAMNGGFSVATTSAEWPSAWAEALAALNLGRTMLGPGVLAGGTELGVYRLLLSLSDSGEAHAFYERTLAALVEHDERHHGDLLQTLQMFFAYLGNHSQAALALHIHRNTLLYRLGRISAISGYQLDRAIDRLALQVGLALHRIYSEPVGIRDQGSGIRSPPDP